MFYVSERSLVFRCEPAGRLDASAHKLRASVVRDADGRVMGSARIPLTCGPHQVQLTGADEGGHTLRLTLETVTGKKLDEKAKPLYVVRGPFDP